MIKAKHNGKIYEFDGTRLWCEGHLVADNIDQIRLIEPVEALKVDDRLYYEGNFYKRD